MIVVVSGTPGTGKTVVSKWLSKKYKMKYLDVSKFVEKKGLFERYDKCRDTKVVDIKQLNKSMLKIIKKEKDIVIDSHMSHFIPQEYVDLCVVCKCNLKVLNVRLKKREYKNKKVRENLDAEIFDVCLQEAVDREHKIVIVDTSLPWKKRLISSIKALHSG